MNIIISACLMGIPCRYDGKDNDCALAEQFPEHTFIPICPEQMGGLSTPRPPAERIGNRVITCTGEDVSEAFVQGAQLALMLARKSNCSIAILKEKSPSCGFGRIYNGKFKHILISGSGVCAQTLHEAGLLILNEHNAQDYLEGLKHV